RPFISTHCESIAAFVAGTSQHRVNSVRRMSVFMNANENPVQTLHHIFKPVAVLVQMDANDIFCCCDSLRALLKTQRANDDTPSSPSVDDTIRKRPDFSLALPRGSVAAALDDQESSV